MAMVTVPRRRVGRLTRSTSRSRARLRARCRAWTLLQQAARAVMAITRIRRTWDITEPAVTAVRGARRAISARLSVAMRVLIRARLALLLSPSIHRAGRVADPAWARVRRQIPAP